MQPVIHYCLICLGSCSESIVRPIEILLKRILRCINVVKVRQMHVSDLYALSKVLTIKDDYKPERCKFVYNVKQMFFQKFSQVVFENAASCIIIISNSRLTKTFFLPENKRQWAKDHFSIMEVNFGMNCLAP